MPESANIEDGAERAEDTDGKGSKHPPLQTFKRWFRADAEHSAKWREEAREDYDFVAGEQWSEEDEATLKAKMRPVITFNRTAPVIRAVSGYEITNRQEVRYLPREQGDVQVSEVLTSAADWFRDECDAGDEESEAFLDTAICGIGWTETRLSYDSNPDGEPLVERIDPIEMFWDASATRANLVDARRLWRVREMPIAEARELLDIDVPDTQLDATWADNWLDTEQPHNADPQDSYRPDDGAAGVLSEDSTITLVHVQWREKQAFWRVMDPTSGQEIELSDEEGKALQKRLPAMGQPFNGVRQTRYVWRQAFIGGDVLWSGDSPCPDHPTWHGITAYRDRNKGTWYGLVRAMKDPQRWANKWLSQSLHILNSTAKGGVMVEADALGANKQAFMESWARADAVTEVPTNALVANKIQPKPAQALPMGFYNLMEFAISSVRDVTGISLEMLGMREGDQPIGLEQVRRQTGMAILATLFNALKRYRKTQGRLLLYYIQNQLSDGRLIRIVGKEGEQYVPLVKQADVKYDIVVDDSPASPNLKEQIWATLGPMFMQVPPQVQAVLIEYSPFPTSVQEKLKKAMQEVMQGQAESPDLEAKRKVEFAKAAQAEAAAHMNYVKAQVEALEAGLPPPPPMLPQQMQPPPQPDMSAVMQQLPPELQQMAAQLPPEVVQGLMAQMGGAVAGGPPQAQQMPMQPMGPPPKLQAEMQKAQMKGQMDFEIAQQKIAGNVAAQQTKAQADTAMKAEALQIEVMLRREELAAEVEAKRAEHLFKMEIEKEKLRLMHEARMQEMAMEFDLKKLQLQSAAIPDGNNPTNVPRA